MLARVSDLPAAWTASVRRLVRDGPLVPRPDVVPFDEEDESPFVGLLKVEVT
jgi:hypothetical protein